MPRQREAEQRRRTGPYGGIDAVGEHRAALVEQSDVRVDLGGEVGEAAGLAKRRRAAPARADGRSRRGGGPPARTGPGSASCSARCRRFSISAWTACWYSLRGVAAGRGLGRCDLPQMPAQRRVAVEAEGDREAGHGGLADPGQFGQLHAGQERRVGGPAHHAVRDAPLGRRQPVPFEERLQPLGRAVTHAVPLKIHTHFGVVHVTCVCSGRVRFRAR